MQDNLLLNAMVEYNKTNNYLGDSSRLQSYLTSSIIVKYQSHWSILYGFARLKDRNYNQLGFNRYLNEINLGYDFNANKYFDKLTTQIGYQHLRTANIGFKNQDINSLGILVRYYRYF